MCVVIMSCTLCRLSEMDVRLCVHDNVCCQTNHNMTLFPLRVHVMVWVIIIIIITILLSDYY